MRLQQRIYVDKPVKNIRLRITATDVPTSATVLMTDIQLQGGEQPTGVVFNPAEVGTTPGRSQYRNGVALPNLRLVALSNADKATPIELAIRNASGNVRVGSYRFGSVNGSAVADGEAFTATHGYGRVPIVTERQDLNLRTDIPARLHMRLSWNERK